MDLCIGHGGDLGEPSGGTDRVSAIAAGLADRDVAVTLVSPSPSGPIPDRLESVEHVHVDPPPTSVARAAVVARTASQHARATGARLQLEHSTLAGVGTLLGIDGYVLDMHDLGYSRFDHLDTRLAPVFKRIVRHLEGRALAQADQVIVVSNVMSEQIRSMIDIPEESVSVVPNGYFPERIKAYRDSETVEGRVAFLGTLHPKVDVETLVGIADLPTVSDMVVVGDGAVRDRLDTAAATSETLRTTGRLPDEDAFELVASAQAVVNPQIVSAIQRSSSPVKLYYYAALGKPMVVTPGPSVVSNLVKQNAAVTARTRRNFLDRVDAILTDPALAQRLGVNARRLAREFTWTDRITSFERLYSFDKGANRGTGTNP